MISINLKPLKVNHSITKTFRSKRFYNKSVFNNVLKSKSFNLIDNTEDVNTAISIFNKNVLEAINNVSPYVTKTFENKGSILLSKDIMQMRKEKNKLYKLIHAEQYTNDDKLRFKFLKHKIKKEIKLSKIKSINNRIKECGNDCQKLWRQINEITPYKNKSVLFSNEMMNVTTANKFNTYFSNIGETIHNEMKNTSTLHSCVSKSTSERHYYSAFKLKTIDQFTIIKIINGLKNIKSCGIDGISTEYIKDSIDSIAHVITKLVNLSITTNTVPDVWKTAIVIPIYKKRGEKSDPINYRPISLLPICSKILEKVVFDQFVFHLEKYQILNKTQFGFRRNTSTSNALNYVCDILYSALDNNKISILILLDLSKAFDSLSHEMLINRLKYYNIYSDWFDNYLSNRHQITKIGEFQSDLSSLNYGVPQGSILGPLLFNIYINEIRSFLQQFKHDLINLDVVGYADDTQLIFTSRFCDYNELRNFSEMVTNQLITWIIELRLKINVDKTQCMVICSKKQNKKLKSSDKSVLLYNSKINFAETIMNLGITFDSDMKFKTHTNLLYKKVLNKLLYINKTKSYHNQITRKLLVEHLALSSLNYCRDVWGFLSKCQTMQLQRLINFGAKIIFCKTKRDSASEYIKKLNWFNPKEASDYFIGCVIFKEINHYTNSNIASSIKLNNGTNTRSNSIKFILPNVKTQYGKRGLNYRTIELWNCLPKDLQTSMNYSKFKRKFKKYISGEQISN